MSENKFYVPSHRADPFDFKRGDLFNRDIEWLLYDNVEKSSKNKYGGAAAAAAAVKGASFC